MRVPGKLDFIIYQGSTLNISLTCNDDGGFPLNFTGFTARLQARLRVDRTETFLDLSTDLNGGITLGGIAGTIIIMVSAEDTLSISEDSGVYDLLLIDSLGIVERFLEGRITVSKGVTR